jgi:hypothetical protein
MANHKVINGTFETGIKLLHERGGQLMPVKNHDAPTIHVCGKNVTTIWPLKSRMRGEAMRLGEMVGYDPNVATTGRIAAYIADEVLSIPYKDTHADPRFKAIARSGQHWHYLYAKPGIYHWGVEIDVKSAYWASFCHGKSCLLGWGNTWIDDEGRLSEFQALMESLPKSLRVTALGRFGAWKNDFYVPVRGTDNPWEIEKKTREHCKHGALFNATHRAIVRVWKFMKEIHQALGENVLRIHTDGIILDCSNGMDWENELERLFALRGFEYSIKGFGHCWIGDVNSVVLGKKIAGSPRIIRDEMKEAGVKINLYRQPPKEHRWFSTDPTGIPLDIGMEPVPIETQTTLPLGL